jgi:hypothetical protein
MDTLTRFRHARQRIVKVERRLFFAQILMWPTVIAAGGLSIGTIAWFLRRRTAGSRQGSPDAPAAHESLASQTLAVNGGDPATN